MNKRSVEGFKTLDEFLEEQGILAECTEAAKAKVDEWKRQNKEKFGEDLDD